MQASGSEQNQPGTDRCLRRDEADGVRVLSFITPILSREMLAYLDTTLIDLERDPKPLVLVSDHPSIFLAGAHLGEIAELDAQTSYGYARFGRRVLAHLGSHPAPVVAAVGGSCSGGGFDLVLSCDLVVAGDGASFSHPGVRRGLVTGWGGTVLVPAAVGRPSARRALLEGSSVQPNEIAVGGDLDLPPCSPALVEAGRQAKLHPSPLLSLAIAEARRLASLHSSRLKVWRCFRNQRFVDRFRAVMVHNKSREEPVMSAIRRI